MGNLGVVPPSVLRKLTVQDVTGIGVGYLLQYGLLLYRPVAVSEGLDVLLNQWMRHLRHRFLREGVDDLQRDTSGLIHLVGSVHARSVLLGTPLANATVAGHLMECAAQVTGGYFADPGFKEVDQLARVGFPIAEISRDGSVVITKLPTTGGRVDSQTVKEQLYYEVHDPSAYITPDVIADFSMVELNDQGDNRVMVCGAKGRARTETLKVTVAFDGGHLAEAEVSYAGPGALNRAQLAGEVINQRLDKVHGSVNERRIDLIGAASLHANAGKFSPDSKDIRLRCALRTPDPEEAANVLWEMEALLCCGPAGGAGYRGHITPSVLTYSALLERDRIKTTVEFIQA